MNETNGSVQSRVEINYNMPLAILKFIIGFVNLTVYIPTACIIQNCHTIGQSSRKLLTMLCSIQIVYYLVLTFYSPLVGMGLFANISYIWLLKLMSCFVLFPIYCLHPAQTVMAADRFFSIKYPKLHEKLFSPISTVSMIVLVYLYGLTFALPSYFDCCYLVYNPLKQVWFYPYDKPMNYRMITGTTSNWANVVMTAGLYAGVIHLLKKSRVQIADERIRRSNYKKQVSLLIIFAMAPFCNLFLSSLVLIVQMLPVETPAPFWLLQVLDFGRYLYVFEPILMYCCLKQFRTLLNSKLLKFCSHFQQPTNSSLSHPSALQNLLRY